MHLFINLDVIRNTVGIFPNQLFHTDCWHQFISPTFMDSHYNFFILGFFNDSIVFGGNKINPTFCSLQYTRLLKFIDKFLSTDEKHLLLLYNYNTSNIVQVHLAVGIAIEKSTFQLNLQFVATEEQK